MKVLKQSVIYLIWIALALLCGIIYMRIVLGAAPETSRDAFSFSKLFYNLALYHVGIRIGGFIAALFVLFNLIYLKKKLKNNRKSTYIRFLVLLCISIIVGVTHYILEKVIDVI